MKALIIATSYTIRSRQSAARAALRRTDQLLPYLHYDTTVPGPRSTRSRFGVVY